MERVPEDPPHEVFTPTILPGLSNQEVLVLRYGHAFPEPEVVDVLPQNDPSVAYKIIKSEPVIDLGHHAPGWGHVFFGIQLQRAEDGHFEEPDPENDQYRVAIKRLNKAVVDNSLAQGNEENPYKEIHRMQTVGDGQHVLNCLDALEDATNGFLYIITRRCDTLLSINNGLDENSYRPIFRRMLDSLAYLHERNICHADIKPENFMVIRNPGYVVLNDLAMSFRIPDSGLVSRRPRACGTPPYMTWEAYQNVGPFDAEGRDLWACLVSLFNIVTGFPVYRIPTDEDILFVYNIMAQALSTNPDNLDATVVLQAHPRLHQMRNILGVLSPQLRELFQNALHFDPAQRWMIDDVIACAWLRGPPYPP